MCKRIVIDEASRIPRYTRLTAQYSCGHCFSNDTWEEAASVPQLCCDCRAPLERINPASVVGFRPDKCDTKISYHKVYSSKLSEV